jgi:ankyrin repeat protein
MPLVNRSGNLPPRPHTAAAPERLSQFDPNDDWGLTNRAKSLGLRNLDFSVSTTREAKSLQSVFSKTSSGDALLQILGANAKANLGKLMVAAEAGDVPTLEQILSKGQDGYVPFGHRPQTPPEATLLTSKFVSPNSPCEKQKRRLPFPLFASLRDCQSTDGFTPLHSASSRGHLAVAKILVDSGYTHMFLPFFLPSFLPFFLSSILSPLYQL